MSLFRNRQPRGMSTGGQFAPDLHDEPAVRLGTPVAARFQRFEDRPRRRRRAVAARAAVAGLVLAASASLTACGTNGSDCPSAAVYDAPAASVAYTGTATALVASQIEAPAKGGGGHGSGGHSSGGHESSTGGHESSTGSHSTDSKGSPGSTPHIWPWSSHPNTCPSPAAKPS